MDIHTGRTMAHQDREAFNPLPSVESKYQYSQIPKDGYIRIITLHPASDSDKALSGDLEQCLLDRCSEYAALSYSWGMQDGNATLNRIIWVAEKPLAITQNLFEGLKRIRDPVMSKRLWIDAICINQDDIAERNAQVAQMAKVYSYASHVIIWLGEGETGEDDRALLELASTPSDVLLYDEEGENKAARLDPNGNYAKVREAMRVIWKLSHQAVLDAHRDGRSVFEYLPDQQTIDRVQELVKVAVRFFQKRYWRRRWIVQELYHAPACPAEIRWGPCLFRGLRNMNYGPLASVLNYKTTIHAYNDSVAIQSGILNETQVRELRESLPVCTAIGQLLDFRDRCTTKDHEDSTRPQMEGLNLLLEALYRFNFTQCADDRDRLFALSSMVPGLSVDPDYSLTITEVSTAFATTLIKQRRLPAVLSWLAREEFDFGIVRDPELPSWVPDLRSRGPATGPHDGEVDVRISSDPTIIVCTMPILGVFLSLRGPEEQRLHVFAVGSLEQLGQISHHHVIDPRRSMQIPQLGDIVCCVPPTRIMVLRIHASLLDATPVYRIVDCHGQRRDPPKSATMRPMFIM